MMGLVKYNESGKKRLLEDKRQKSFCFRPRGCRVHSVSGSPSFLLSSFGRKKASSKYKGASVGPFILQVPHSPFLFSLSSIQVSSLCFLCFQPLLTYIQHPLDAPAFVQTLRTQRLYFASIFAKRYIHSLSLISLSLYLSLISAYFRELSTASHRRTIIFASLFNYTHLYTFPVTQWPLPHPPASLSLSHTPSPS